MRQKDIMYTPARIRTLKQTVGLEEQYRQEDKTANHPMAVQVREESPAKAFFGGMALLICFVILLMVLVAANPQFQIVSHP